MALVIASGLWFVNHYRVFIFILSALAGILCVVLAVDQLETRELPPQVIGKDLEAEGRIVGLPQSFERGMRFKFQVDQLSGHRYTMERPMLVRLSWYNNDQDLQPNQRWRLRIRLKPVHGFMNPGGFDYEAWMSSEGIRYSGYVRDGSSSQLQSPQKSAVFTMDGLRQYISMRIQSILDSSPGAGPGPGLLTALANGDRRQLSRQQWQVLQATGTSHLMAISGLHVGLVAAMAWFLFARLWRLSAILCHFAPAPRAAAVGALTTAFAYAALAGFALSTQRALIMLSVVILAFLWHRPVKLIDSLSIALVAMLLYHPLAPLSISFWLSFSAVVAIGIASQHRTGAGILRSRFSQKISAWIRVQFLLSLLLYPVLVYTFGYFSLVSPLANLIAIPVVGFLVVPLLLLGVLLILLQLDILSVFLIQIANEILALLWVTLENLQQIEFSTVHSVSIPLLLVLFASAAMAVFFIGGGLPGRSLLLIWPLLLLLQQPLRPEPGEFAATFLDVGQGTAIVVETENHLMLYDSGARFSRDFDAGAAVIVPYIRSRGYSVIDRLVLSHSDTDHIGGFDSVGNSLTVNDILGSGLGEEIDGWRQCRAGQHWSIDGVDFVVLSPATDGSRRGNNASCVLLVRGRGVRMLLTGDIESAAEEKLLQNYPDLRVELLAVPHHGSRTSSGDRLLRVLQPELAVVNSGYRNRYGHPHTEVLARYHNLGINVLNTSEHGAIEINTRGRGFVVDSHRRSRRFAWRPDSMVSSKNGPPILQFDKLLFPE